MQGELYLIHLGERAEALQNLLEHLVHIGLFPAQDRRGAVHTDQAEKIVNDLCFSVNLLRYVAHKLFIEFQRCISHADQRIREHTHRSNRRLQLVRDIRDKFFARLIQGAKLSQGCIHILADLRGHKIAVLLDRLV